VEKVEGSIQATATLRALPPRDNLVVGKNIINQTRPIHVVFIKIKLGGFGLIAIGGGFDKFFYSLVGLGTQYMQNLHVFIPL
jgi:hypothetical protein